MIDWRRFFTAAGTALALVGCADHPADNADGNTVATTTPAVATSPEQHGAGLPSEPAVLPAGVIPKPGEADFSDPDQVAAAAVAVLYTVDTSIDHSPTDAYRRARPWLTDSFAAALADAPPARGADWLELHHGGCYTTITNAHTVYEYGPPADTDTTAYRIVVYRVETVCRTDALAMPAREQTAHIRLHHTLAGWKVEEVQL